MLKFIQLVTGFLLILVIVPQTPTENIVLRKFAETGFFTSYGEAKAFVKFLTWGLIGTFLVLTFFLSLQTS
jgi:preprotein translocase subunit SecG